MISPFSLKPVPTIQFGPGSLLHLSALLSRFGSKFLILTGARFADRQKNWSSVADRLRADGATLNFRLITSEPTPAAIDAIVDDFHGEHLDCVVAIGGGSVLDGGKAVSAMLPGGLPVHQFLEEVGNRAPDGSKIAFIAIPTTAGTGSEATNNAVITEVGPAGFKKSLRHDRYIPDVAVIDPELMCACPAQITAACGMDTFSQLVEGFLSTKASTLSDTIAWSGIEAVRRSLIRAVADGHDLEARTDMAYAALCSGIVLTNAGLGVIHGLAPPLGSLFAIPHGTVCGTLMAAGNEITLNRLEEDNDQTHPALQKYLRLGKLFGRERSARQIDIRQAFIEELYRITEVLELPRLSGYGVTPEDLEKIVGGSSSKNNPVTLNTEEVRSLLLRRI